MHRPFVRATMVLALLVCALSVHGWHDSRSPHGSGAATAAAAPSAVEDHPAADRLDPVAGPVVPGWHPPHGSHLCRAPISTNASYPTGVPAVPDAATPPVVAGSDPLADGHPAGQHGRLLLLLRCVSRT